VPEPGALASEVARILRPGGVWWATTPHARGASGQLLKLGWSVISPPEHLHLFSARGLQELLLSNGFKHVRIKTEGVNPVELLRRARGQTLSDGDTSQSEGTSRVRSSYRLNEALVSSAPRRAVKDVVNGLLRVSRLGDSLKIWAER